MEIQQSYLMWIGSEHYESFEVYAEEAKALGVSKRLPGVGMGRALMERGSVVFVAHDDGETKECRACKRKIPCPDCRKRRFAIKALKSEIEGFKKKFSSEEALQESGFAVRSLAIRQKKIDKLEEERQDCETCDGRGKAKLGSGGSVTLNDGRVWDYRTYNYWLHQPEKFDAEEMVLEKEQCEACGGLGTVPKGQIRGMFLPETIEYILSGEESETELEKVGEFDHVTMKAVKREPKRKGGKRNAGGVYAVTSFREKGTKRARRAVEELVEKGLIDPESCEVTGSFVTFMQPIDIAGTKRFRGIAKWALSAKVKKQAKLALDDEDDEDEV